MLRTTLLHSLPESTEMAVEMGSISLSMMSAKRSDSKVTNVHRLVYIGTFSVTGLVIHFCKTNWEKQEFEIIFYQIAESSV